MKIKDKPEFFILCFLAVCITIGCDRKKDDSEMNPTDGKNECVWKGEIRQGCYNGRQITYETINGLNLLGDIIIPDDQIKDNCVRGVAVSTQLWPNGVINFMFDVDDDEYMPLEKMEMIVSAMSHWEETTGLEFNFMEEPHPDIKNYVKITGSCKGSYSNLGMVGKGEQILNIGDDSDIKDVVHELGHTIGLVHEQCSSERDKYISVILDNISINARSQFDIFSGKEIANTDEIDFNSIMMYGSYAYSGNKKPTMVRKENGDLWDGYRGGDGMPSAKDIAFVKKLYSL